MSESINLKGLDKAAVLAVLYNASKPQGLGFLQFDSQSMTIEEAQQHLERSVNRSMYFDYLKGRVMKIDLSDDMLDPRLYDRDNGEGAAAHAIQAFQTTGNVNPEEVELQHLENTRDVAIETRKDLGSRSSIREEDGVTIINLGLDEYTDEVESKIDDMLND